MGEWRTVSLGDIAIEKGLIGGPFGSSLVSADYTPYGIPVIRGTNLNEGKYVGGEFAYVSEEKYSRDLSRNYATPGDIIFTQRGTLGQVAIVPKGPFDAYVISQSQMRLRVNRSIVDSEFIYYAALAPQFIGQLESRTITTGVPHINLGILSSMTVRIPSMTEQNAIAKVLRALDEKIISNQRALSIIHNLVISESVALGRQGGELVPLQKVANWIKGVSYKSAELVNDSPVGMVGLKAIGRDGAFQENGIRSFDGAYKASQVIAPGELIVACTDLTQGAEVIGRAVRVPINGSYVEMVASLDLTIFRPANEWSMEALFGVLANPAFQRHCLQYTSGTTVLHLSQEAFKSYRFPDLTGEQADAFSRRINPQLELADHLNMENLKLIQTRNFLLRSLFDRSLTVHEADHLVGNMI